MATVHKIRPKRHDVIVEALQLVLDFGDHWNLKQETRDDIAGAVGKLAPPEKWSFVMMNPEQQRLVIKAIDGTRESATTLKVWATAISYIAYDRDGEIMAARSQIAEAACISPEQTSRALTQLAKIGAIIRIRPGRYRINPHVGWSGPLPKRQASAKDTAPVKLRLVERCQETPDLFAGIGVVEEQSDE